jgi:hypothetical protein
MVNQPSTRRGRMTKPVLKPSQLTQTICRTTKPVQKHPQIKTCSSMTNKPNKERTGTLHSDPLTLRKDIGELDTLVREDLRTVASHPTILDAWHLPEDSCKRSCDRWLLGHIQNDRYHRISVIIFSRRGSGRRQHQKRLTRHGQRVVHGQCKSSSPKLISGRITLELV